MRSTKALTSNRHEHTAPCIPKMQLPYKTKTNQKWKQRKTSNHLNTQDSLFSRYYQPLLFLSRSLSFSLSFCSRSICAFPRLKNVPLFIFLSIIWQRFCFIINSTIGALCSFDTNKFLTFLTCVIFFAQIHNTHTQAHKYKLTFVPSVEILVWFMIKFTEKERENYFVLLQLFTYAWCILFLHFYSSVLYTIFIPLFRYIFRYFILCLALNYNLWKSKMSLLTIWREKKIARKIIAKKVIFKRIHVIKHAQRLTFPAQRIISQNTERLKVHSAPSNQNENILWRKSIGHRNETYLFLYVISFFRKIRNVMEKKTPNKPDEFAKCKY